jgi:hypothetical protein
VLSATHPPTRAQHFITLQDGCASSRRAYLQLPALSSGHGRPGGPGKHQRSARRPPGVSARQACGPQMHTRCVLSLKHTLCSLSQTHAVCIISQTHAVFSFSLKHAVLLRAGQATRAHALRVPPWCTARAPCASQRLACSVRAGGHRVRLWQRGWAEDPLQRSRSGPLRQRLGVADAQAQRHADR